MEREQQQFRAEQGLDTPIAGAIPEQQHHAGDDAGHGNQRRRPTGEGCQPGQRCVASWVVAQHTQEQPEAEDGRTGAKQLQALMLPDVFGAADEIVHG